jgi:UDP-N-acetylmuramate dehydrogenase
MEILQNVSLRPFNTFGIDGIAEYFTKIHSLSHIEELSLQPHKVHILGGGSNVLLSGNISGLLALDRLVGIKKINEDDQSVWLEVSAGEVWHDLVMYTIANGWGGIENLALIPGTVGAAPIQNIGAYGVEVRETIEQVTFWHLEDKAFVTFTNRECGFGYRDSVFKNALRQKAFIASVVFRLSKFPKLNTSYGAIEQEMLSMGVTVPDVRTVAQAVINIRSSKLPDPKVIGNAGSFFKNPTVAKEFYMQLALRYPDMPHFPVNDSEVKIPAAWLIERCGWKGYRRGDAGVHTRQALVLVNYGGCSGSEIWQLSGDIISSVASEFNITLEREVQVW